MAKSRPDAVPFTSDLDPPVRGYLHRPIANAVGGIVLSHGAGSNSQAQLVVTLADAFADAGLTVLRCDLPYRQKRRHGPPFPKEATENREGLRNAVSALRHCLSEGTPVFLGGHSYGGRQATMLAAEDPAIANGLFLASYPLHPPRQPAKLRTDHFPSLQTPALFLHGTADPFGSVEEMEAALKLIPARTLLLPVEGAGHDLGALRKTAAAGVIELAQYALEALLAFFELQQPHP